MSAELGNDKIPVGWVERQRNPSLCDDVMGFTLFYPSYESEPFKTAKAVLLQAT